MLYEQVFTELRVESVDLTPCSPTDADRANGSRSPHGHGDAEAGTNTKATCGGTLNLAPPEPLTSFKPLRSASVPEAVGRSPTGALGCGSGRLVPTAVLRRRRLGRVRHRCCPAGAAAPTPAAAAAPIRCAAHTATAAPLQGRRRWPPEAGHEPERQVPQLAGPVVQELVSCGQS